MHFELQLCGLDLDLNVTKGLDLDTSLDLDLNVAKRLDLHPLLRSKSKYDQWIRSRSTA